MTTRYLKQHKTNYVTIWSLAGAKRKDQTEISAGEALELLKEQQKTMHQRMAEGTYVEPTPEPIEETGVAEEEGKVDMSEPEPEEDKADEEDAEIKMLENIRVVGKGKAKIEAHMLEKYGIDVDRRRKLDELVDQAVAARKEELEQRKTADPEVEIPPEQTSLASDSTS